MNFDALISDKVKNIPPSGIRKYFDLLDDTHISLGVGEPDFPTPAHVCEAAKAAIDDNFCRYTAVPGIPELRFR